MENLAIRNQKIIDAVINKVNKVCPESLAMIGIYGSFLTGDVYEKSDLDLLVLINDDKGWQLGCAFIQDDLEVGHDIYCTTWEDLQMDSDYTNPNISKLMDSKIVYCANAKYMERLESLRQKVNNNLSAPFSKEDYIKAENMLKEAEHSYLLAMISEDMADIRLHAGGAIYYLENAIAMLNKKYFRYGTKRVYEELEHMENKPYGLSEMVENVLSADSVYQIRTSLTTLIQENVRTFQKVKTTLSKDKKPVTADSISGTYEELFSNWRNKMYVAADKNDKHLAFMSMISLNAMFSEVSEETEIGDYNVLKCYYPQSLMKTAKAFDGLINNYLKEYHKVDLQVKRYKDIDEFVRCYLE